MTILTASVLITCLILIFTEVCGIIELCGIRKELKRLNYREEKEEE